MLMSYYIYLFFTDFLKKIYQFQVFAKMDLKDTLQAGFVPKSEPIDTSFIKSEKSEDKLFVFPGILESDKSVIKKEKIESDDSLDAVPSLSNVSQYFFSFESNNLYI